MTNKLRLITASEAAKKLGVHHKTVSRLVREGRLNGVKVANRWLIDEAVFDAFGKDYVGKKGRPRGWSPKTEAKQ